MKKVVIIFLFFIGIIHVSADRVELTDIECIDGDTIKANINGNIETIRFLAIDTPETKYSTKDKDEPFANEASEYTCDRITNNKVEIEFDEKSDKTDKYGRYLGWIFINDNLLQKELISLGYAKIKYVYDDYKYVDELKEEEQIAKEKKLGIWSDYEVSESLLDKIFDRIINLIGTIFENIMNFIKKINN